MSLTISVIEKRFNNKLIFKDFSYSFPDKGIFALVGNSGAGKTTLLRMIASLDTKFKGKIDGGGFKNVSFAFQEYRLFSHLNALDNVLCTCKKNDDATRNAVQQLFTRLGFASNDIFLFPRELSGGMKQRVSLVRALMKEAPILLLDEPTKELDHGLKTALDEIILQEGKHRTVIIVSHDPAEIERLGAKKIYI